MPTLDLYTLTYDELENLSLDQLNELLLDDESPETDPIIDTSGYRHAGRITVFSPLRPISASIPVGATDSSDRDIRVNRDVIRIIWE
jgi:hypothetical protein